MPVFWSLRPIVNACAAPGASRQAASSARMSGRRWRAGVTVMGSAAAVGSGRGLGSRRPEADSASDADREAPGARRAQPHLQRVEGLDRAGVEAWRTAHDERAVEA